jgi:hypothetical protein
MLWLLIVSTPLIIGDGAPTNGPPKTWVQLLHIVFIIQTTENACPTRLPGVPKTPVKSNEGKPGFVPIVPVASTSMMSAQVWRGKKVKLTLANSAQANLWDNDISSPPNVSRSGASPRSVSLFMIVCALPTERRIDASVLLPATPVNHCAGCIFWTSTFLAATNKCLAQSDKSARGAARKGRELPAGNYRPASAGDLDDALAAVAGAVGTEDRP